MNANSVIAQYVADATAGKDTRPGSPAYVAALRYMEAQMREVSGVVEYNTAKASYADRGVPANGGYEEPLTYRTGRRLLYVYNFKRGVHAYLDCDRDVVLSDREAQAAVGF